MCAAELVIARVFARWLRNSSCPTRDNFQSDLNLVEQFLQLRRDELLPTG